MPAPPPPPPPVFNASNSGAGDQDRSLLLQSIRAGKSLKKTVTVDKSAPIVSGRVKAETGNSSSSNNRENNNSSAMTTGINNSSNGGPIGLGGLFSSGMPKLKPTGLRTSSGEKDASNVNNTNFGQSTTSSVKRGPPPVPPPATQKPQIFAQKTSSMQGQSTTDSANSNTEAPKGFGKPIVAPKPPPNTSATLHKPSPPPKKLNLTTGGSVSRAQSMRLPRSPPVLAPTPPSLHQSQDCLNETQPRPTNRILRPPVAKPPSPPTSRANNSTATATRVAPPPPSRVTVSAPCIPPPPPPLPHRPAPTHQRLAPPPPPPPTPPTRSSSMRNGQTMSTLDLEVRFADMFHSIANFPPPEPFKGFTKVYSSRNAAKQQAPAPPMQMSSLSNTMVPLNTSSGG
ncbi:uncharacterized protein LOC100877645 [Megachile rotundata]|uniref:uncharacterized protein LOC100877645 n=1 Tax=Megachile rotundata TaxID=143995 RepID=UPI000258DE27|nr:PREDICTED: WAS/WASL-interacting protein family member 1-like [Megachile rotundata]XP_012135652.1 PREDICTED: WAS/WASL-interacting protein family member 1-like [Megachile rotundata]